MCKLMIEECASEELLKIILHIKKPPIITRIIGAIVRACYPFYSGCGTFANSKLIGFLSMGSQNTVTWCNVSGGKVLGSLQEYVGRSAYFCGDLDKKLT